MKKTALFLLGLTASCQSLAFEPKGSPYLGAQLSRAVYDETGLPNPTTNTITFKIGRFVTDTFSIEGRLGSNLSSADSAFYRGVKLDIELDQLAGVYARKSVNLNDRFGVFGLFGYTKIEGTFKGEYRGVVNSFTDDESDVSFGVGAEYKEQKYLFDFEVMQYLEKNDTEIRSVSLGASVLF